VILFADLHILVYHIKMWAKRAVLNKTLTPANQKAVFESYDENNGCLIFYMKLNNQVSLEHVIYIILFVH
jgi:hypothetical protein